MNFYIHILEDDIDVPLMRNNLGARKLSLFIFFAFFIVIVHSPLAIAKVVAFFCSLQRYQ